VSNFIIGLTDVSPAVETPTLWNYYLCGQRTDPVGLGETVYLRCADKLQAHRYLVLQIPRVEVLNFCELQVYVRRTLALSRYCIQHTFLSVDSEGVGSLDPQKI